MVSWLLAIVLYFNNGPSRQRFLKRNRQNQQNLVEKKNREKHLLLLLPRNNSRLRKLKKKNSPRSSMIRTISIATLKNRSMTSLPWKAQCVIKIAF